MANSDGDVNHDDDNIMLRGMELTKINQIRGNKKWQFHDVRNNMIETLLKCINERFQMDGRKSDLFNSMNIQYNSIVLLNLLKNELHV